MRTFALMIFLLSGCSNLDKEYGKELDPNLSSDQVRKPGSNYIWYCTGRHKITSECGWIRESDLRRILKRF